MGRHRSGVLLSYGGSEIISQIAKVNPKDQVRMSRQRSWGISKDIPSRKEHEQTPEVKQIVECG